MHYTNDLLVMSLRENSSMTIIRCSFCGESLLGIDRRPDILLIAPRILCSECGIESQWHGCFHNEEARRYLQQAVEQVAKEPGPLVLDDNLIRHVLKIATAKGWQDLSQKP